MSRKALRRGGRAKRGGSGRRFRNNRESAFRDGNKIEKLAWLPGNCRPGLCGEDAACIPGKDDNHKCVCPSDLSAPTEDKLCLTRKIVPLTPSPIRNINISGGSVSRNRTIEIKEAEKTPPPETVAPVDGGLIVGLLGLICIVVVMGGVCWWRRKIIGRCGVADNVRKHSSDPVPVSLSKGLLGSYVPNPQYAGSDTIPVSILPREILFFEQEIGEGCFGKVFKGELRKEDGSRQTVAIKVLKESASKQAEEDFMREVEIMSTFRHANILSLVGIVLKENAGRPWMVFEYMQFGDLAEVLRRNSKQLWKPLPGLKPLTKECFLRISLQIAAGMKYLAGQRFVHNDLACRNCLVGTDLTVKIADFGMSRDIYTCDYYRLGGSRPVPLRWMSPESVMYRRFTLESDVWSYGVVLWEIYSLGKQPYYGFNNEEVMKMILQGMMLIPPENCPPFICDLMKSCWKSDPKDRIKFPEIYDRLQRAWKEKDYDKPNGSVPLDGGVHDCSGASLPRPPVHPVSELRTEETDLLDSENYLAPQVVVVNEYLEPLPD